MQDERQGLVSASKIELVAMCAGEPELEAQLIALGKPLAGGDQYSEMGERIHKARELSDESVLQSDEEVDIYHRGLETEKKILDDWCQRQGVKVFIEKKEVRMWLKWPNGEKATSGRLDVHYVAKNHILIVEWKTLYCSHLTAAERNLQGMTQAVLAWREYGAVNVEVAFNKAMFGSSDRVAYDAETLPKAERKIFQHLWESQQPGAQRSAGEWCGRCPCKPYCPEAGAFTMLPSVVARIASPAKKKDVIEAVAHLTPADWKYIWQRGSTIRNILDAANACLKALPADQLAELSLQVGKGRRMETVTDPQALFSALVAELPESAVWPCFKFTKTGLVEAVMGVYLMTEADAKAWVAERIGPYILESKSDGSLEEI